MDERFEVAAGSVVGRLHVRELAWRNNQDACAWAVTPAAIAAVVCDGCGSEPHSEVGARLGARLTLAAIVERVAGGSSAIATGFWDGVEDDVLERLAVLARAMGGSWRRVIHEHFLFTICGALVTEHVTALFALGDGVLYLNGERLALPSYPDNAPPYLAYRLVDGRQFGADGLHIRVRAALSTRAVESMLIATDGAEDLIAPGGGPARASRGVTGRVDDFWTDDAYFRNAHAVARRLALLNRSHGVNATPASGGLPDDTTLVVIRRRRPAGQTAGRRTSAARALAAGVESVAATAHSSASPASVPASYTDDTPAPADVAAATAARAAPEPSGIARDGDVVSTPRSGRTPGASPC